MKALVQLFVSGGPLMAPLALCSVLALAVILERLINLRSRKVLVPEVVHLIETIRGPADIDMSLAILDRHPGGLSNVVRAAIENRDLSREEIRNIVLDVGRGEAKRIERGQIVLEAVAGIAPLLGLLGTVLGMIRVFRVIALVGVGNANALSGGISLALITTAVGLSVAIPALPAFHYFSNTISEIVLVMERLAPHLLAEDLLDEGQRCSRCLIILGLRILRGRGRGARIGWWHIANRILDDRSRRNYLRCQPDIVSRGPTRLRRPLSILPHRSNEHLVINSVDGLYKPLHDHQSALRPPVDQHLPFKAAAQSISRAGFPPTLSIWARHRR